jgi:hypothetical protein
MDAERLQAFWPTCSSQLTPQQAKRSGGQLAATYLGLQVLRNAGSEASLIGEAIAHTLSDNSRRERRARPAFR